MKVEKKMKGPVLVTGATGFIGKRVVKKLLEQEIPVRALVLPGEGVPSEWQDRVEIVRGSISDPKAVEMAVSGAGLRQLPSGSLSEERMKAGTIIHLAAVVSDWGDEKKFWEFTVEGSRLVFDQAVKNEGRVVLISSIVVYGDRIYKERCHEEAGFGKTFGPYSRTKKAQEKLAWEYHHQRGMALTVIRPANVYGPGSGPWLHDVVNLLRSGSPGLISGGEMNAGLVYVDNVADLILLSGASEKANGRAYNASDGLDVTWRRYFSDIARIIGAKSPGSVPRPVALLGAYACEAIWTLFRIKTRPPITQEALNLVGSDNRIPNERARQELSFQPAISYDEGISHTREYIKQGNRM